MSTLTPPDDGEAIRVKATPDETQPDLPGLALFPLRTVLFPGGLLGLKVFEARYLDLMGRCLREQQTFAVVCLKQGEEVQGSAVHLERCATLVRLDEVDAEQAGILKVRCSGTERVQLAEPWQQDDGLWRADAWLVEPDELVAPPPELQPSAQALVDAIEALRGQGVEPFAEPHALEDAGWVANRWCEILPISLSVKQRLMALEDPVMRLRLIDEFLRTKGVVPRSRG